MNLSLVGIGVQAPGETKWKQGFCFPFHLANVPIINEFIDRAEDMEVLERVLPRAPPNRRQVLILHGMGGIGKTQLAVEFARKHQTSYSSVCFIDADSKDSLLRSFLAIYRRIAAGGLSKEEESANSLTQLEDVAKKVLNWFDSEGNDRWLLIFDNVDRAPGDIGGFDIQAYFPSRDLGSVLVTTRLATLPISGHRRALSPMSVAQSLMLLRSYQLGTASMDAERKLLESLAGLPLALSQAGRFISSLKLDIDEYLDLYNSSKAEVISQLPKLIHHEQAHGKGSVATTWLTSINLLKDRMTPEDDCGKHHRAYHLLRLFAYFDPTNLDFEILRRGLIGNNVPGWFRATFQSRIAFYSAVGVLLDLSLLDRTETKGSYAMHRVMYEWLVHVLVRETDIDLLSLAVAAVGFSIPDVIAPRIPDEHAKLILHANAMLPRLVQRGYALPQVDFQLLGSEDLNTASTLLGAEPQHLLMRRVEYPLRFPCNLFWMDGRQTVALDLLNKSIRYLQGQNGFEDDPLSLVLMYTKHSKTMVTKLEEADNVLRNLMERFDSLNLPYWKIKTGNMLALLMKQQLKINEAVNYWQQLLPECRNLYGPFHELTCMVFHNMMGCLVITGVSKAKQHVEAIREDTEAMAPTQPKARELLRQLGLLYLDCGDFKEADQVLRKVLSLEIELNGQDSIEAGHSHAGLAHLGLQYPQEDSLFHGREWRRIQEHVYGSTPNRGTAASYIVLAELLCMRIFGGEAEPLSCFMRGSEIYGQLKDFERVEKIKIRMEYIRQRGRMEYVKRRGRARTFGLTIIG
jgi:tetratricopeptide (TPR) repeat protein